MEYTGDFDHTTPREGEFSYKERMTDERLDGWQESCTVVGNALFEVFCGVDALALDACKPVSCGEPISVSNAIVDTRAHFFPESVLCL